MLLWILLITAVACESEEILDNKEPADLQVEITPDPEISGKVLIEASADNTEEYQLRIGQDQEPVETNTDGLFEYTFEISGLFNIDVRAYGSSGRYLRKEIPYQVVIEQDSVSVGEGYTTPLSYDGYDLVWHDEFEGDKVNPEYWVFESGDGCPGLCGWGNNEMQYYREENARVADGVLTIEARREDFGGKRYTSARIKTEGKQSFQYGRIDIRALLPEGQGIWPALWMLGNDIETVGWPRCGEIDIMEMIGGNSRENQVHGTLHWDSNGHASAGGSYTKSSGTFADEYHVFSIIWDETYIRWFVNDIQFHEILITPTHMTEFHQEFFFIFNVAVGGNWPGNPDESTTFPQQMKVDYVRVFQEN
ncbi:MAG: family 16 glycosylhydrolase [Bacteroidales bacterium]